MPENTLSGEFEIDENSGLNKTTEEKNNPVGESDNAEDTTVNLEKPSEKKGIHFYSSYGYFPKNVLLSDQETGEEIVLVIRRRFVVNVPWIATAIFFALIGPFIFPLMATFLPLQPIGPVQSFIISAFYYLVIFGFVLTKFTLWYFHVSVVTNKRIIDVDIHGILLKDVAETRLNQVQDVNYKQIGFIPSLFNFGDVFIQTAGANPNIEFDKAPEPAKIARIIADMIKKHP